MQAHAANTSQFDFEACQTLMQGGSKTFFAASRLLPHRVRGPAIALYAFCRVADDAIDFSTDRDAALVTLYARLDDIYANTPQNHEADRALAAVVRDFALPRELLTALLEGFQWDAEGRRYNTIEDLQAYGARVAGSVGAMMAVIMRSRSEEAMARACDLGVAMQLTNIIRDVGDDARRGRIYLPVSELQRFEVKAAEVLARTAPFGYSERFTALMKFQAQRAHGFYDEAFALLPEADRAAQKPGLMMANIYRTLLREIEADNFQVLHQRTSLTPLRKLWIAVRTNVRGR